MQEQEGLREVTSPKIRAKSIKELDKVALERFLTLRGSEDLERNRGIEIPDDPTFLRVAELNVHGVKVDGQPGRYVTDLTLRDVNVLFCHGESDGSQFYTVKHEISIPELIAAFEERQPLSAAIICNEGSFKLRDELIYPIGEPPPVPACFNSGERGIVMDANLAFTHKNFWPTFHIPEKLMTDKSSGN